MNKLLLAFATIAIAPRVFSQAEHPVPRLAGIVNLPDMKRAVLEIHSRGWRGEQTNGLVLAEGERDGDIAVRAIHADKGSVEQGVGNSNIVVSFPSGPSQAGGTTAGLVFENANLGTVLPIYQDLIGRTLLRHPSLPSASFSLRSSATNRSDAARQLETAISDKGIAIIPDGDKFMMVVPKSLASTVKPGSMKLKSSSNRPSAAETNASAGSEIEVIPAGTLNFAGVHPIQVSELYSHLLRKRLDQSSKFPATNCEGGLFLKNETPLTQQEVGYAFETLLRWAGVKLVPAGDKLLKAVPAQ